MFWLRNKKNSFQLRTLIWRPVIDFVLASTRSTKDSELQPIKGGSVVDMDEEQSQMVCCTSIKMFAL